MITPVILCGGAGSRLWPLSRESYPKQLLSLTDESSLLIKTVQRLSGLDQLAMPIIICGIHYRELVARQLNEAGLSASLVLEPTGRNTAPAALTAALLAEPTATLLVLPADHLISDADKFLQAVAAGEPLARSGALVTFGIVPDIPETGYGYIQSGKMVGNSTALRITRFVEKPNLDTAKQYLDSGDYYWNSGMFLFAANTLLDEMQYLEPEMVSCCQQALAQAERQDDTIKLAEKPFSACPANSIDYALMEKTDRGVVIPLDAGWSDIGSWNALWQASSGDAAGNVIHGETICEATLNSYIHSDKRLIATVGVEDLAIVDTTDALLVAKLDRSQDVKIIVDRLKAEQRPEATQHALVHRPWGTYISLDSGPGYQVKRITVYPGELLSLQLHHHRSEHWTVVSGTARVTCGDEIVELAANQAIYIPLETKHRLENIGDELLTLIEVQCGDYLGEDDIVRFEDRYGR